MRKRTLALPLAILLVLLVFPTWTAPDKGPQEVEVTNFPPSQNVNGTISVGNFPQEQLVYVTNLPLDADGNLKVTGQVVGPGFQFFKLPDELLIPAACITVQTDPIPTIGFSKVNVFVRIREASPVQVDFRGGTEFGFTVPGGGFIQATDLDLSGGGEDRLNHNFLIEDFVNLFTRDIRGPEMVVTIRSDQCATAIAEIWVHLSN